MRKYFFLFLVFATIQIYSQSNKATIFYKNGDSIQGYINRINYDDVKFSKQKKGKYKWIKSDGLDKLIIYSENGIQERHYLEYKKKKNSKKSKTRLAILVVKGKVNYYIEPYNFGSGFRNDGKSFGMSQNFYYDKGFNQASLYVKRNNEKYITLLSTSGQVVFSKNFKKTASEYFKDCKVLVSKIESGYYKKANVTEMVEFYNEECR
ncbi:hypothetical protein ACKGJY_15410 [Hyunsoonleella sp. 2307UL5-6]|uniref:hypothetical protein n=1 Tax=Hyunsoonleella sp. 2307UL5-6 TaxID=3384768 RepID=UPI0039BC5EE0